MSTLPFGPWEPDSAGVDSGVLQIARNAYALKNGWGPVPALLPFGTDALPAKCVGGCYVRTFTGGYVLFVGTRTKLYRLVGTAWVDYTRVSGGDYAVPEDEYWSMAQYGSKLIAVNFADDPQVVDVDSGDTNFSLLSASAPKARYVGVVGDFAVLAALSDNPRKLRNSAINDSSGWVIGTNLCDEQEFADGGRITGFAGGEFGWILQEKAIRRMIFQAGSDIAFRFERVEQEHGATAGYSLVSTANGIYFLSADGFFQLNSNGLTAIGADRINTWFHDNCDTARLFSVTSFSHPFAPRIAWAFYNAPGSTNFDRILIYDWHLDRWMYAEIEAQYWFTFGTPGTTLEQLDVYGDIDGGGIPYPFDSRVWEGGQAVIGAVDSSYGLSFLEGSVPLDALLLTSPMRMMPGGRAKIGEGGIEPVGVFNGASMSIRVGRQENNNDAVSFTASSTPSARTGVARLRASGRIMQIELSITQASGTLWSHAQGLNVDALADGSR